MDEDTFHKVASAHDRWVLSFDTSKENVQDLWSSRDELERLLHQHWSAIELDVPPKVVQVKEKSVSSQQLTKMFSDALSCGVFIAYADTRVVMLLDHSVVSGHLGCRLTTWVSQKEWADYIGMPAPSLLMELMAMTVGTWRIWRIPIIRNFWFPAKVIKVPPAVPTSAPSKYVCHFNVGVGTHPQVVMHQVLTRVTAGWRTSNEPSAWTVCSAAPFQEIPGVSNNVGVMSYTFPIEPACSTKEFRDQLGYAKWQVVVAAAANRAFAGKSGVTVGGAIASRIIPDMDIGRSMIDALFSFMVMKLGKTDAVHLYSSNDKFGGPATKDYGRQKAFIAAAYDKSTGRVHVTLQANLRAYEPPDEAQLLSSGFEPFERFGPYDKARLCQPTPLL